MQNYNVLVVEDDLELRKTVVEVLSQNKFSVREASDGVEALEKVKAS